MNTVIAQKGTSNDYDVMSPALTQEKSQDVVEFKQELGATHQTTTTDSLCTVNHIDKNGESCKLMPENYISFSTNGSTNSTVNNIVPGCNMTPRIILPSSNTLLDTKTIEYRGISHSPSPPFTYSGIDENMIAKPSIIDHIPLEKTKSLPSILDLTANQYELENRISAAIKRARHLQCSLSNGHSKYQLTDFVEDQCTRFNDRSVNNSQQLKMSVTVPDELHSMSTTTLVELVQRMQTDTCPMPTSDISKTLFTVETDEKQRLQKVAGVLSSNLKTVMADIDSDATASSSGGETDEEDFVTPSNDVSELSIRERLVK